jgi:hypothetical protein
VHSHGEAHLQELEELPGLVEEYLRDLPEFMGPEIRVREYETVPGERTEGNPLGLYCLMPERVRRLSEGNSDQAPRRRGRPAASSTPGSASGRRFGADDTLEITVAATNTKGAMPWDEPSSPSTTSTPT